MSVRKAKKVAKRGLINRLAFACIIFGANVIYEPGGMCEKLTNDYKKRWSKKYARLQKTCG